MLTADQFTRDLEYGFRALSHNRTNIPKNILTVYRALFADLLPIGNRCRGRISPIAIMQH